LRPEPIPLLRRVLPSVFVLVVAAALFVAAQLPSASAADRHSLAGQFRFTQMQIDLPAGLPERHVRQVNPAYEDIRSWISSVGAGIAVNDLEGTGKANDLCLVDTRSDSVVVTPAPDTGKRFAPFVLTGAPLAMSDSTAPMGCVPGDFNADGRMDLLVYYWGRTPIVFLHKADVTALSPATYVPTELVPWIPGSDGRYHGRLWNTNAVAVADYDADGHPDVGVFNYFPDSQVLNPVAQPDVEMNHSLSKAENGGGAHILHFSGATAGATPSVDYQEQDAIDPAVATGWTLAAASGDLDGDLQPELYIANDFGNDRLLHNVSTPGNIKFDLVKGRRGAFTPKSMVLGNDSFKSMSAEFGDLQNKGRFDIFVSNITASWGLEESNFVWSNNADDTAAAKAKLARGTAPFDNKAAELNMAWTGWGWDAKMADFDGSGNVAVVQTDGFVKGDINRWNWLQELAMSNDMLLQTPHMWPKAGPGDDIAGSEEMAFWVREPSGRYVNLSAELGMNAPTPTRGVAVGDPGADGSQDFAIARQWEAPVYYHNDNSAGDRFLGLHLYRPSVEGGDPHGSPAYGATVTIKTASGRTHLEQLDGGGGHSGKRSFDLYFGLGDDSAKPVSAMVCWRDNTGAMHEQTMDLSKGWHSLMLTDHASEVTTS